MVDHEQNQESIISAGIDIGTSTTKLIISRFLLMNVAGSSHIPRIEIVEKEILHKSPIYRTPLVDSFTIDVAEIENIIRTEYEIAGLKADQIGTGALIITGETATKHNARKMIHYLSDQAGDFLVATAGPDLEGIIAAKGSGAYDYSKRTGKVIANIDIGGGTANIAVYKEKVLLGTCTMHIGGRLIEFRDRKISSISPPIQKLSTENNIRLQIGDSSESPEVNNITRFMAESLARILKNEVQDRDRVLILGNPPNWTEQIDVIVFSGGISECIYAHEPDIDQHSTFDDIGKSLAGALEENKELKSFSWVEPVETIRATVLGAGTQTTEISGATIQIAQNELPLKNIPVYTYSFGQNFESGLRAFEEAVLSALEIYDDKGEGLNFALYITELPYMRFKNIQTLSQAIIQVMEKRADPLLPIILVFQSDLAKVLGQTLIGMNVKQSVICVDQIKVEQGDYIDIGSNLGSGVVPVVVKTLTFHSA